MKRLVWLVLLAACEVPPSRVFVAKSDTTLAIVCTEDWTAATYVNCYRVTP